MLLEFAQGRVSYCLFIGKVSGFLWSFTQVSETSQSSRKRVKEIMPKVTGTEKQRSLGLSVALD